VWEAVDWIRLSQDRGSCRPLMNTVMNLWVTKKTGNFLTSWATVSYSGLCSMLFVLMSLIVSGAGHTDWVGRSSGAKWPLKYVYLFKHIRQHQWYTATGPRTSSRKQTLFSDVTALYICTFACRQRQRALCAIQWFRGRVSFLVIPDVQNTTQNSTEAVIPQHAAMFRHCRLLSPTLEVTAPIGRLICELWFGKNVKGSGRGLFEGAVPEFTWRDRGELQNTSVRISGLWAEIWTRDLPKAK
jgi:hypothetical protein